MKTCHLHIGMHKTGSSSIQNYLDENRSELLKSGFYYAEMGGANHSGPFLYCLGFEPAKDTEIANLKIAPDELNRRVLFYKGKLADSLKGNYSDIIFSAESIIKLTRNELLDFKENLLKYVDEIKVYCYVREPMPFMVSSFQQIIKTMPVFLDNQNLYPNYQEKLEKFESVFGSVNYRLFSRDTLFQGDVTADFCSWIDLPYFGAEETNNSLGALAVKFLYKFQHLRNEIIVRQSSLELIENTLSKLPYQKVILPTKEMARMINDNVPDFIWMSELLKEKAPDIIFNIKDDKSLSFGNIYGVFSECEKVALINLAKMHPEFDEYILAETDFSVAELISLPLPEFSNLMFYIRRTSESMIQGWAVYKNDSSKIVDLAIFLNDQYVDSISANIPREDILDSNGGARAVGYKYEFEKKISSEDLITVIIGNNVAYSGNLSLV